jgi:NADH-quinone oxidoreductase subunit G
MMLRIAAAASAAHPKPTRTMDTVTLTIDGRQITAAKGKTVLQAAIEAGIQVPYYCYHPALGVDGSCRVCLVKIEKMPKLQVSCSVPVAEGMVVQTQAPDVIEARAGVFEFLLLNHPLDCPVCDKGGECPLQDFSYSFGPDGSRMEFPRRVFDGEGVKADVDFGPTLMLNRNRCILCTRCVRFMKDIDGDAQIGIVDRGNGSEIATFEEQGVHSLLSGNLMDVCPVGAITTRDYRFKSRPWDNPAAVDTICTLCEKGCNTTAWVRAKPEWAKGAQLVRFTPRSNPEINDYWMCDIGRFNYHWIEGDERLTRPLLKAKGANAQTAASWDAAITAAANALKGEGTRVLITAHASHEELYATARLAQHVLGDAAQRSIFVTWTGSEKQQPARAKFQVPTVDAPNVAGARAFGLTDAGPGAPAADLTALRNDIEGGRVSTLYVLDPGPAGSIGDVSWIIAARESGKLPFLIVQGVLYTPLAHAADVVLPGACWIEKEASYTNAQGHLQSVSRVMPPPGEALEDVQILVKLAEALQAGVAAHSAAEIRQEIASALPAEPALAGIQELTFARPIAARHWLQASNPSERWKWDFMFQDLPPVKFADTLARKPARDIIPLTKVD